MKILTIVGARPQFIKAAPVSREISKVGSEIILHTGQHYDENMSDVFFDELKIPKPKYNLGVGSKSHAVQTADMLKGIEEVLLLEAPDLLMVYGDTNSTLAGALAASKLHIPIAHVEAGLRSFNRRMPEEINRVLSDHVSSIALCPTKTAVDNLHKEGIDDGVYLTGDVMLDAVKYNLELSKTKSNILEENMLVPKEYLLVTLHRAENTDNPSRLKSLVEALNNINIKVILPIHPRTKDKIEKAGLNIDNKLVKLIPPVGYLDMLSLQYNAKKIVTDSGGVQKEAFFLKVPCITTRDETEWVETVTSGANILVSANTRNILKAIDDFTVDFTDVPPFFGQGNAGEVIVNIMGKYIGSGKVD